MIGNKALTLPANIKSLILDMDGVLWRDNLALLDMPRFFAQIKELGLPVVFATNNGTRSIDMYVDRLADFGVTVEPWQVVNSAIATAEYLLKQFPQGGVVYAIGETGVMHALKEKGFEPVSDPSTTVDPIAVVAGMDRAMNYEKLARAALFIRAGKPFIFTNPDLTFPTPLGLVPGAGALMTYLEAATGVRPMIMGKPEPHLYRFAMERLGTAPAESLAVGDRLDTDILGGQRAGCPTVLVLSGVTSAEEARRWQPQPDLTIDNLADLLPYLASVAR